MVDILVRNVDQDTADRLKAKAKAEGKSVSEIAKQLSLSIKTVSTHKSNLLENMGIDNQPELVRYAVRHKLIDEADDA